VAVRAVSKGISASPKRLMPMLDLVRGKPVEEALSILAYLPSPWARSVAKVVKSAASNAENNELIGADELRIVAIYADGGAVLKRFDPRARGRVGSITKRTSHVTVIVDREES